MNMNITLNQEQLQDMIDLSIKHKKVIRITYTDREGKYTSRQVEPVRWVDKGCAGIMTRCHLRDGNYRHFKLGAIDRLIITDYDFCWVNPADVKERAV
jgi:predicted DNA-binding transcriptional regulator YafY